MPLLADRVLETTTTTGTGSFSLAGALTGYRTFNSVFTNGDVVYYTADNGQGEWEVGYGTVGTGTLTRNVIESSNANALVVFSAGVKRLFCTAPAQQLPPNQTGNSGKYLTTNGTAQSWGAVVTSVSGTGTVSGISLSGTITTTGNLTLGGTLDLSSPPAIGGTAANTGKFTTLTATGTTTLATALSGLLKATSGVVSNTTATLPVKNRAGSTISVALALS